MRSSIASTPAQSSQESIVGIHPSCISSLVGRTPKNARAYERTAAAGRRATRPQDAQPAGVGPKAVGPQGVQPQVTESPAAGSYRAQLTAPSRKPQRLTMQLLASLGVQIHAGPTASIEAGEVAFPSTMVDRITPVTEAAHRQLLELATKRKPVGAGSTLAEVEALRAALGEQVSAPLPWALPGRGARRRGRRPRHPPRQRRVREGARAAGRCADDRQIPRRTHGRIDGP